MCYKRYVKTKRLGGDVIILDSARKHGISDVDMLAVIADPYVIAVFEESTEKLLEEVLK